MIGWYTMMSLYDVTEAVPANTAPKYRRNGARYGQTACVGGCVDRWSSSLIIPITMSLTFSWSYPSHCRKLWYPKCWNWLLGNFDVYLHQKSQLISNFCKLAFSGTSGMFDHTHQKILLSIRSKLSCLSACKKSSASLTPFIAFCREIENLLF